MGAGAAAQTAGDFKRQTFYLRLESSGGDFLAGSADYGESNWTESPRPCFVSRLLNLDAQQRKVLVIHLYLFLTPACLYSPASKRGLLLSVSLNKTSF